MALLTALLPPPPPPTGVSTPEAGRRRPAGAGQRRRMPFNPGATHWRAPRLAVAHVLAASVLPSQGECSSPPPAAFQVLAHA